MARAQRTQMYLPKFEMATAWFHGSRMLGFSYRGHHYTVTQERQKNLFLPSMREQHLTRQAKIDRLIERQQKRLESFAG